MHSSRMRTDRCCGRHFMPIPGGGVRNPHLDADPPPPRPRGRHPPPPPPPWTERLTDAYESITFPCGRLNDNYKVLFLEGESPPSTLPTSTLTHLHPGGTSNLSASNCLQWYIMETSFCPKLVLDYFLLHLDPDLLLSKNI